MADSITNEDCIKTAFLVLEMSHARGMTFDQQLLMACGMLELLKSSHVDLKSYTELEDKTRQQAEVEIKNLFGK